MFFVREIFKQITFKFTRDPHKAPTVIYKIRYLK